MKKIIVLLASLLSITASANPLESTRCTEYQDSLGTPEATQRNLWAWKCYPGLRAMMKDKMMMLKDQGGVLYLGYPIFAKVDSNGAPIENWVAPIDENAPCVNNEEYSMIGICRAGCYTPEQEVLFSDGFLGIKAGYDANKKDIVTVSDHSTIDNIDLSQSRMWQYTVDNEKKQQEILEIETAVGQLRVTTNHPLVSSSGEIKEASLFKVGDKLVHMDGTFDAITSIKSFDYFGKVYNIDMGNTNLKDNIHIAQGYLSGSVLYQNVKVKEANREIFRTLISASLVD